MSDLSIEWDNDLQTGDLVFSSNDLELDNGLKTAVYISLFTDQRAAKDDAIPDTLGKSRRGWWGDQVGDIFGYQIGSKLWLLERAKITDETLALAVKYVEDALQWMIDDGIVASIDVIAEKLQTDILGIKITIMKQDGTTSNFTFDDEWENT